MKLRGTLGGLNLLLEPGDTVQAVQEGLEVRGDLLASHVTIEIQGDAEAEALEAAMHAIRAAGGTPGRVRAPRVSVPAPASPAPDQAAPRLQIVPHTLRAGTRESYPGSVIVLGDVNPGAEILAEGDVIVVGALRGLAHAGCTGNSEAIVWARPIASAQIRIADVVARAPEGDSLSTMRHREEQPLPEIARLHEGAIRIDVQR